MQGDRRVIEDLDGYLQIELTGHKQYLLAGAVFERWGLSRLRDAERAYAQEETAHAAVILHRLLLLGGVPHLADVGPVTVPTSAREQLERDQSLVTRAILHLKDAIGRAQAAGDAGSRELLEEMLVDEEKHLDWLEQQLHLHGSLGEKKYLQAQL
ncbi:MAG: hypothetical protein AMXMBFR34_28360 [Myxococcaceae bacterium]